jgi:integrase
MSGRHGKKNKKHHAPKVVAAMSDRIDMANVLSADKQTAIIAALDSTDALHGTCAMIVLQATKDIRKVSLWLGHSDLTTTEVYVRADPTEKLEAIDLNSSLILYTTLPTAPPKYKRNT